MGGGRRRPTGRAGHEGGARADEITCLAADAVGSYTGLRAGEIGALRVKRIDFQRTRVEVAEAVSDVAGQLIVGPTKTYANRHVPMPSQLAEELVTHLGHRRNVREELVLTSPQVGALRHGNFYRAKFQAGGPSGGPARRFAVPRPEAHLDDAPRSGGEAISGDKIVGIVGTGCTSSSGRTPDPSRTLAGPSRGSMRPVFSRPAACGPDRG